MEIKLLTKLRDNSALYPKDIYPSKHEMRNEGMTESEIDTLEQDIRTTYYPSLSLQQCHFPLAFKELLFLAGHFCYALEKQGSFIEQDATVRRLIARTGESISRPFFTLEQSDSYLVFFLDEDLEDPLLYFIHAVYDIPSNQTMLLPIEDAESTIKSLIELRIDWRMSRRDLF